MSAKDAAELGRFVIFLRAIHQAEQAGVNRHEAAHALYPDVYEPEEPHNPETCRDPSCDCYPF